MPTPTLPLAIYNKAKSLNARRVVAAFNPARAVSQVISATAAGTVSGAGNLTATVTAAGLTGSPIALNVAVIVGDTPASVAQKVRQALAANAYIAALFYIDLALDATITLRKIIPGANDGTLNLALATGTATGITAAPTATQVTAGSASGAAVAIIAKLAEIKADTTVVDSKFPDAQGVSRAVIHVATEGVESVTLKDMEDFDTVLDFMVSLSGLVKGTVQFFFISPDDAPNTCRLVSDVFDCAVQRGGNISTEGVAKNPTLEFLSEKLGPITWSKNVAVTMGS